ncbi:MAG TPA: NUDIX domain-containing protein [bacterium]|jgi:8-oxo-dGTP diphosphatase
MPDSPPRGALTHRVAVGAYLFRGERILLLLRANPPLTFAPPGGKLNVAEDPEEGLRREVREETGLDIEILGVAHTWFGAILDHLPPMLGIDYIAECASGDVTISDEHHEFVWATREQVAAGTLKMLDEKKYGYAPEYILQAFDLYERLKK